MDVLTEKIGIWIEKHLCCIAVSRRQPVDIIWQAKPDPLIVLRLCFIRSPYPTLYWAQPPSYNSIEAYTLHLIKAMSHNRQLTDCCLRRPTLQAGGWEISTFYSADLQDAGAPFALICQLQCHNGDQ